MFSRALLFRCVSIIGTSFGFYLPLSVVPLFAQESGSAAVAGMPTVALLLATVACELITPRLIGAVGYRWSMGLGLALLGGPTLILTVSDATWVIIATSLVRGAGFAVCVVTGVAITAMLIPAERRGEGLALVGIVSGVSGMIALPGGVWLADRWGYEPVFAVTGLVTLLALTSVLGLPRRGPSAKTGATQGVLTGLRSAGLMRPATIFAAGAAASGVVITFLPLAAAALPVWIVATALLAQRATATVARWVAGRLGDRKGQGRLLAPGLLLAGAGIATLSATGTPAAVIGGASVFGVGFGLVQNVTLTLMYSRAVAGGESAVSALWNAAYDLGMAAGALGAGLAMTSISYPTTFLLASTVVIPALVLVRPGSPPQPATHASRQNDGAAMSVPSSASPRALAPDLARGAMLLVIVISNSTSCYLAIATVGARPDGVGTGPGPAPDVGDHDSLCSNRVAGDRRRGRRVGPTRDARDRSGPRSALRRTGAGDAEGTLSFSGGPSRAVFGTVVT